MVRGCMIAGTHSGVGKTTVAVALMAALRRRGLRVMPFKVGPDFIDPGFHTLASGQPSRNLDGWMLGARTSRAIFEDACQGSDLAVIEGMMGLFDGVDGSSDRGSAAEMAKWLDLPVVLVIDAWAVARSAAAIAKGFAEFDPQLKLLGVIFNRVAGPRHMAHLRQAMSAVPSVPLLGGLTQDEHIKLPERHLGLVTAGEQPKLSGLIPALSEWLEAGVDLDGLLERLGVRSGAAQVGVAPAVGATGGEITVAVARDEAFCFYYHDSVELLRRVGAKVQTFSPLHDSTLPAGTKLVYLGGGYPEVYAERLAGNVAMVSAVRAYVEQGGYVYAECGGFMYLCRELTDLEGKKHKMVGVVPLSTTMKSGLTALGYREVEATAAHPLFPPGARLKGHVFHYSMLDQPSDETLVRAYKVVGPGAEQTVDEGFAWGKVVGGYLHLHFMSNPEALAQAIAKVAGPPL